MPTKSPTKKTATKKKAVAAKPTGAIPFHIGSDPEYLLFYGQRGLDASRVLTNFFQNDPLFSRESEGFKILANPNAGNFGWDGSSSTGELRPKACKDVYEHVDKIGAMLKAIHDKMPFVDITTLSIGSPIGGHIHVDSTFTRSEGNMTSADMKKRKQADKIMTTFLLPLVASDHRISAMARLTSSYGKLNDIRYESKSNCVTAEIRGLTAEWMTTPKIAASTLAYVVTVWNEINKRQEELFKHPNLMRTNSHSDAVHRLLLSDYNLITDALTKDLKKVVREFELYPQFKNEIEYILSPNKVYKDKEKAGWTINKGWGFNSHLPKPTKRSLLDSRIVQEILNKEDVPNIERSFAVNYNDDYNVAMFAKAISDRVATMNWPLKNNYALFGFRKGFEGFTALNQKGQYYVMSNNATKQDIMRISKNMFDRIGNSGRYGSTRINPKTGKTIGRDSETIVIGIPYDLRANDNVIPMIELIWAIENGKISPQSPDAFTVTMQESGKEPPKPDLNDCVESSALRDGHNSSYSNATEQIINDNE